MSEIDNLILHNRYVFLLLLTCIFLSIIFWKVFRPKEWELPERWEDVSYSEDIPEWIKRTAKEDLDWGHGVGLFPELQRDDELGKQGKAVSGDNAEFRPRRRWKTLMSSETLIISIVFLLILAIIIIVVQ